MRYLMVFASCAFAAVALAGESEPEKEIRACLNAWKTAMLERDEAALNRLYADDLVYTHTSGRKEDKAQAI